MMISRRGAATGDVKLWLACGFAAAAVGAAVWSAFPSMGSSSGSSGPELVAAEPTDEAGNLVETNYRPASKTGQRESVIQDFGTSVQTLAAGLPTKQVLGAPEELATSTQAVLSMLLDPSEDSIAAMFASMGGDNTPEEGEPSNQSMLVKFIKGMFGQGELDLDRMVVRPKPDDDGIGGESGPRRVSRDSETRERAASDEPGENRRVAAIRLTGPYEGAEELAEKQRPIEVRVPYRQKGDDGERVLALDLLYNPGARKWQMIEMRFEQLMVESDG